LDVEGDYPLVVYNGVEGLIKSVIDEALNNVDKYIDKKEQRINDAKAAKIQNKFREKYGDKRNSIDNSDAKTDIVEGFASPFNSQIMRLIDEFPTKKLNFCSLSECDSQFGSLGNFFDQNWRFTEPFDNPCFSQVKT
jgi:hypothetical protein